MVARYLGLHGHKELAWEAFECSRKAAGPFHSKSLEFRVFNAIAGVFGWKALGRAAQFRDRFHLKPGKHSMKWSWAD